MRTLLAHSLILILTVNTAFSVGLGMDMAGQSPEMAEGHACCPISDKGDSAPSDEAPARFGCCMDADGLLPDAIRFFQPTFSYTALTSPVAVLSVGMQRGLVLARGSPPGSPPSYSSASPRSPPIV